MKTAKFDFFELLSRVFWICIAASAVSIAYLSIFIFQSSLVSLVLTAVLYAVGLAGIISYRAQKLILDRKTIEIHEANRLYQSTVEALASAIDARDQIGRGHVNRTQLYSVRLGEMLGLGPNELEALNTAALLHDIGKLAVPDHILNKPGALTPAELEKVKTHAAVGAAIVAEIGFPYPVTPIIEHHHERWDGKGYPKGLSGPDIPLTARILSIADTYDTLRLSRPYRPSVTKDGARVLLRNAAGSQFDPELVKLFLRNLNRLEEEAEEIGLGYLDETVCDEILLRPAKKDDEGYVDQIKRANREVFTLFELAKVFGSSLNIDETLSLFSRKISEMLPLDTCVVYLLNETGTVAIARHAEGLNGDALKNRKLSVGSGATGFALENRRSVSDRSPSLDFSSYQLEFVNAYRSMASVPLIAQGKLLGAVTVYSCDLEKYEEEHMRLLETVSKIASDAIWTSLTHAETEVRALTDPMTGLPNARSLQARFESEISRARRTGSSFHLLMIDLDGFKSVNDNFGHKAGDLMLKSLSDLMKDELREYDFLARYAGDEFVVIVPESDQDAAEELSKRIERAVGSFRLEIGHGRFANVGASIGSASYPEAGATLDQMIIAADKAMYAVKERRKYQYEMRMIESGEFRIDFPEPLESDREAVSDLDPAMSSDDHTTVDIEGREVISSDIVN